MKAYQDYEHLVEKVLVQYGVSKRRHDYDDFAQELRLALYMAHKRQDQEGIKLENPDAYFFHLLQCKMKNLFRQQAGARSLPVEDQFFHSLSYQDDPLHEVDWMISLREILSPREVFLVSLALEGDVNQVCGVLGCSKRTLSRWLQEVRNKIKCHFKF